jgi:hypothetical protein
MPVPPVPQSAKDVFIKYPNAKPIFMVGTKLYLNHFEQKALRQALLNEAFMYRIDDENTISQVYPEPAPLITYQEVTIQRPISLAYVQAATKSPSADNKAAVQAAFLDAASEASTWLSVTVDEDGEDSFAITIQTEIPTYLAVRDGLDEVITLKIV